MQDQALLESVSELITLAGEGINSALAGLPPEANDDDKTAALDACQGGVETIAMAAEIAQLEGLQQLCCVVNQQLGALNGEFHQMQADLGSRLVDWSDAVLMYVRQPNINGITEPLLALVPTTQRAAVCKDLDQAASEEAIEVLVDGESAITERSDSDPDVSLQMEATPALYFQPLDTARSEINSPAELLPVGDNPESDNRERAEPKFDNSEAKHEVLSVGTQRKLDSTTCDTPLSEVNDELMASNNSSVDAAPEALLADSNWDALEAVTDTEPTGEVPVDEALADAVLADESLTDAAYQAHSSRLHNEVNNEEAFVSAAAAQLADTFNELESWQGTLADPERETVTLATAATAYNQVLERIQSASMALGLDGLSVACELLSQNVQALATAPARVRTTGVALLAEWPVLAQSYLAEPDNAERQFELAELLSRADWPLALSEEQTEELLIALSLDSDNYLPKAEQRPTLATAENVALAMDPDINPKLVQVFLQEAPANAANFTSCLEQIGHGENVAKNLATAQRLAHNLKGSANLVGIKGIANLTHHIEDILEYLSVHQQVPQPALRHTLQEAADCLEIMLEAVQGIAEAPVAAQQVLQNVLDWAHRMDAGQIDAPPELSPNPVQPESISAESSGTASVMPAEPTESAVAEVETLPTALTQTTRAAPEPVLASKTLRVQTETLDALFRMVGEVSIALDQIQDQFQTVWRQSSELQLQDDTVQQRRFQLENYIDVRHLASMQQRLSRTGRSQGFDPLEMDQYDELYSTTRSFIETVADSRRMAQQLRSELSSFEHVLTPLRRMKSSLQDAVMQIRMEPVETIVARLQRSVRQACRSTGKQAELQVEGADILLDSEVLDKLTDPLMHMLRNAVDHGIEAKQTRLAKGKPQTGVIQLRFFQQGQNVVVECIDDGCGLDYQSIRQAAVERGLLSSTDSANPQDLARLILIPGFSTRSSATQLSGRGVGMDVVQTTIRELKGVMEIGEASAGGCRIALRLPITLMTSHSLVVKLKGELYAIPTGTIMQVLSPRAGQFTEIGTAMAYEVGKNAYPAISLAASLGLGDDPVAELKSDSAVVLVYSDTGPVALAVDQFVNSYHLVLKSLGRYIGSLHGVAGLSTMADGHLIPVLDVAELLRSASQPNASRAKQVARENHTAITTPPAVTQVLIVDDSLSVRQSLSELMEEAGYQALLARDGVEAVDMLRQHQPAIVLSDIEMPRMNGLELVQYIRTTHSSALPVVMITSRTMQKHRQQAEQAGANGYVTKPFNDDALLQTIRALLHEGSYGHAS